LLRRKTALKEVAEGSNRKTTMMTDSREDLMGVTGQAGTKANSTNPHLLQATTADLPLIHLLQAEERAIIIIIVTLRRRDYQSGGFRDR
jgi:hypothetical protein